MIAERRGFCPDCNRNVLYRRTAPNHILHLLLSCVTLGFWLPVWFLVVFIQKPFRCPNCGHAISHVKILVGVLVLLLIGMGWLYFWVDSYTR